MKKFTKIVGVVAVSVALTFGAVATTTTDVTSQSVVVAGGFQW